MLHTMYKSFAISLVLALFLSIGVPFGTGPLIVHAAPSAALNFEGETTANTTSGITTSNSSDSSASGGQYLQTSSSTAVGSWVEFTVNVPTADTYSVEFGYKQNTGRGISQLSVDGKNQGGTVDQYASTAAFTSSNLGTVSLSSGSHKFRFTVTGKNASSNSYAITVDYFKLTTGAGDYSVKDYGAKGDGSSDDTSAINSAITAANAAGGGKVVFPSGTYLSRSIHLKSNVQLYINTGATIKAISGIDSPESNSYDNYQDFGHSHWHNALMWGENVHNVKIIGTGTIDGNGVLSTSDNPGSGQGDKAIALKLSSDIEIGGLDDAHKLNLQRFGHFAVLATGVDTLNIHNVHVPNFTSGQRDVFDIMQCNDVTVTDIYSEYSADDIVKLGSDYSLGYKRPMSNIRVDKIVGFTNCNLFQIGSETAGDISNVHVSNLTVLGAGKAGFSISVNDGSVVDGVVLDGVNTMTGTTAPIFIEISNRGRAPGAGVGKIKNVTINNVTATNAQSSKGEYTSTIAGFKDGNGTYYVENITLNNVKITAKGSHPNSDASITPPELSKGNYNVKDFGIRPSYGFWLRHVKGVTFKNTTVNFESNDNRYAVVVDDAGNIEFNNFSMAKGTGIGSRVQLKNTVKSFYMHDSPNLPTVGPADITGTKTY
ncbi:glycosyl hydrolase family 28-related protein [Paenibacillus whitsoniae]|nr:glycosyl hydrolase family 28-related protein [Paenibacillus whitsoniae]